MQFNELAFTSRRDVSSMIVGQIRATQDEAKSLQLLVEVIGRSLKGEGSEHLVVDELSIAHQRIISGLKAMARASQGRDPPSEEEELAYPLLDALGRSSTRSSAFQICTELGLLGKHDNFMLAGSVFSSPFSAEALASSEQILSSPPLDPDESTRKDLTHLRTYTIDSESTREVDDALSIEQLPDGRERLWVHIADVSRWVREGDHLHVEASRRQTTLYLPDAIYPMFPMILAKDIFSLNTGEPRCALSMGVILAEDGSIEDVEVTPSLVQVDMRLSYEDADEMLREGITGPGGEEESLGRLYHWSGIRKALRCSNGSVDRFMRPPQFTIKVEEDPEAEDGLSISISPDDPELPSVNLVSEMMIMSGEGMALVARQHGIGMPFRVQPPPESIPDSEYFDDFPERFCRAKAYYRFMSAASVTSSHAPHWGLGLNSYVQWSSPIRRFNDLAVHYQVKKWLRGDPLLDGPQIAVGVSALDGTLSMATKIARKSDRYWLHEYLRRAGIAAVEFEAYVISSRDSANGSKVLYEFLLTELGSIVIHAENSDCLALGETVIVTVRGASPRDGMLRLVWRRAD
jgi:exoribonuclease-2